MFEYMSYKHIKLINTTVLNSAAMPEDIDAQIKALQERKRELNRTEARTNLIKVAGNKNSTDEQMLAVCYSFIGTHSRLNSAPRRKKSEVAPVQ